MRKTVGAGAVVLGVVGVLVCAAAIGLSWWAAGKAASRIDRIAARLVRGLSEVDEQAARVESRVSAFRTECDSVRTAAEAIAAENVELPRVQAEIERLLGRLVPTLDRADALADALRSVAGRLRTIADVVDELTDDSEATVRARNAAAKIESGADSLNGLRADIEGMKSVEAARATGQLVAIIRKAAAGSERLNEGLAAVRQQIVVVSERIVARRDKLIYWVRVAALVSTLVWIWGGLGQLCLIGAGRRRFSAHAVPG